jgi:hypothetical protein
METPPKSNGERDILIDLSNEPELQKLIPAVDMDELLAKIPRDTPIHRS